MSSAALALAAGLCALAYLAGSVPFSYLVARACGVDLRTVGSGNIGGANVWRSCGFGPFVAAAALDLLKGMLPTLAALWLLAGQPAVIVLVGLAAILGHTFPLFLNFRGGKAVATSGGVLLALFPLLMLLGVAAWALAFLITRISSVGSLTAAAVEIIAGTVFFLLGQLPLAYALFIWVIALFVVYLHRENIQRLLAGTENRFTRLR
ncbi:MAG: glycerol-3-phosphate 1-O-acyltransferase PlsY [Kouleothrix sp.]|jgi:glycerol-3-phosphate acyltransferase PlsY|nr:glycerol-3-phosphate 1-O-acyltransferase PlsY [Kouleothrix sp.]